MIASFIINTIAVIVGSYLLPGVYVDNPQTILFVAVIIGLINTFIKPIVRLITLPINVVTLGLFSLVTNALLVLLASVIVPGFHIQGFVDAFLFALILTITSSFLGIFKKK